MTPKTFFAELSRTFPTKWKMTRQFRLPTRALGEPYYISWSPAPRPQGEGWENPSFHSDGIIDVNSYRNPVQISQYALYQHAAAVGGDARSYERFIKHASYLRSAQREDGGYEYPIALPAYGAEPGFISAMAQGEAASVFLRAFAMTNDRSYIEAGLRSLNPLSVSLENGGASYLRGNDVFFEEIATLPACHILNGHLYAAFGLWEYVHYGFATRGLCELHKRSVDTLDRWLDRFDLDGWSSYDLALDDGGRRHIASLWYHSFHIAQLNVYAAMTGFARFAQTAKRWQAALDRVDVRLRVWQHGAGTVCRGARRRATRRAPSAFLPMSGV